MLQSSLYRVAIELIRRSGAGPGDAQNNAAALIRVHNRFVATLVVSLTAASALELAWLLPELHVTLGPAAPALSATLLRGLTGCYVAAAGLYAVVARADPGTCTAVQRLRINATVRHGGATENAP